MSVLFGIWIVADDLDSLQDYKIRVEGLFSKVGSTNLTADVNVLVFRPFH